MNPNNDIRSHFGLTTVPFTREIHVHQRWKAPLFDEPFQALKSTVLDRMSACLIAPSGTGKTLLLRALFEEAFPQARFRVHYVALTGLTKKDFYREVAFVLGCNPKGHLSSMIRAIQDRCFSLMDQEGLRPVLIIDEAHDMNSHVLTILRVLTNFVMDSRLVLSLLLAGQPSLKTLLNRDDLESVTRRMAHFDTLRLLGQAESVAYIRHRLTISGSRDDLFDPTALDAIYECAQGNLRATNHLCLKSLQMAAARKAPLVEPVHVAEARQKLQP